MLRQTAQTESFTSRTCLKDAQSYASHPPARDLHFFPQSHVLPPSLKLPLPQVPETAVHTMCLQQEPATPPTASQDYLEGRLRLVELLRSSVRHELVLLVHHDSIPRRLHARARPVRPSQSRIPPPPRASSPPPPATEINPQPNSRPTRAGTERKQYNAPPRSTTLSSFPLELRRSPNADRWCGLAAD